MDFGPGQWSGLLRWGRSTRYSEVSEGSRTGPWRAEGWRQGSVFLFSATSGRLTPPYLLKRCGFVVRSGLKSVEVVAVDEVGEACGGSDTAGGVVTQQVIEMNEGEPEGPCKFLGRRTVLIDLAGSELITETETRNGVEPDLREFEVSNGAGLAQGG